MTFQGGPTMAEVGDPLVEVGDPLVEVNRLAVSIGGQQLLSSISLTVHRGEAVAVTGVNGSGKTTLLRAIAGLVPATSGQVCLAGRPVDERDLRFRASIADLCQALLVDRRPSDEVLPQALRRPDPEPSCHLALDSVTDRDDEVEVVEGDVPLDPAQALSANLSEIPTGCRIGELTV